MRIFYLRPIFGGCECGLYNPHSQPHQHRKQFDFSKEKVKIKQKNAIFKNWACSLAGRAPRWHRGGQGFESPQVHYIGHEASQLLGLHEDGKRAALGEFSNRKLERRASRAAACENLPSGKLLVGESL